MLKKLISFEETRKYLGISKASLYRLLRQGKIPASKVGGLWKFKNEEVDNWLKKQRVSYNKGKK